MEKNFLQEAFQRLNLLEDDFNLSDLDKDKVDELKAFVADDIEMPEDEEIIDVIDPNAKNEGDLEDIYTGKVILECACCHSRIYKEKEDVIVEDDLANVEEPCPVCGNEMGFLVIGKIEAFNPDRNIEAEAEDEIEPEENEYEKSEDDLEDEAAFPADDVEIEDEEEKDESLKNHPLASEDSKKLDEGCEECDDCEEKNDDEEVEESLKNHPLASEDSKMLDEGKFEDEAIARGEDPAELAMEGEAGEDPEDLEDLPDPWGKDEVEEACIKEADCEEKLNPEEEARMKEIVGDMGIVKPADRYEYAELRAKEKEEALEEACPECGKEPCECEPEAENEALENAKPEDKKYFRDQLDKIYDNLSVLAQEAVGVAPELSKLLQQAMDMMEVHDEEINEAEEQFPNPDKHEEVGEVDGIKIYHCNDCGKFAAMIDGKKVKKDSKEELEAEIKAKNESLTEGVSIDMNNKQVNADDAEKVNVDLEAGIVNIGDVEEAPAAEEIGEIVPLDDAEQAEIEANNPEMEDELAAEDEFGMEDELAPEEEPGEEDFDIDDFEEEDFDEMGESFITRTYDNVASYKTTGVKDAGDKFIVEGIITYKNNKQRKTEFVFENARLTKRGKLVMEGYNNTFSTAKKAFTVRGTLTEGKFAAETFKYDYTVKQLNESNEQEAVRVFGRIKAR